MLTYSAPYTIQSITNREKLKGRNEQLRELRLGFASRGSFMITGQKRVGKTSLVNVFFVELRGQSDILPLYISIGELSAASGDDLGRLGYELIMHVLEEYMDTFHVQAAMTLPTIEEFRQSFNDCFARCVRQFSKQYPVRLALALDDFDELPMSLFTGSVGKSFFLALRALMNSGTSFFFIGSERLPAIMKEQAERLNQVKTVKVDYLSREALFDLIREPIQGQLEYTDAALNEIALWSARNPYFATLICSAIWQRAIEERDYWVTEYDVREASNTFVKKSSRNSYEHFWSDSPLSADDGRRAYETRSSYLLLALSKLQPQSFIFAKRREVVESCGLLDREVADLHLQELITYNVVETHEQNSELVRLRVPLFTLWLKSGGATELEHDEVVKRKISMGITRDEELSASEVVAAAEGLTYQEREIGTDAVRVWASQFGSLDDQRLMLKLLHRLREQGLYTQMKLRLALKELHEAVWHRAKEHNFSIYLGHAMQPQNIYVTHADEVGESGSALVRLYRTENKMLERVCGTPEKVFAAIGKNATTRAIIICIDDFIGSGHSATEQMNKLMPRLQHHVPHWHERVLFIYAAVVGFEKGIKFIEEHVPSGIVVLSHKTLTDSDKAFDPGNTIFETVEERKRAHEIAHKIGLVLQKEHPLGWEDSQALVVFPDNVPNNTLPIFHRNSVEYNGRAWRALFPRS